MKRFTKTCGLFTSLTLLLLSAPASPIGGRVTENCSWTVPNKITSGDYHYGVENGWNWCRGEWLGGLAKGYGMSKDRWDNGMGWNDACNTNRPFARVATAKVALQVTAPNRQASGTIDRSSPFSNWAGLWTVRTINDLRPFCNGDSVAAQVPRFIASDYIRLNVLASGDQDGGWFFGYAVPERTSILVHEARHQEGGFDHRADGRDRRFSDAGAYRAQIAWLWWYVHEKRNAPVKLLCSAQDWANKLLAERFVEEPDIRIDELGDLCD